MTQVVIIVSVLAVIGIAGIIFYKNSQKSLPIPSLSPTPTSMNRGSQGTQNLAINDVGRSGVSGFYQLYAVDGVNDPTSQVRVVITLGQFPSDNSLPAHIHNGTCATEGEIKHTLSNVVAGRSDTLINISLANFKADLPMALKIKASPAEPNMVVACVDLNADGSIDKLYESKWE